MQDQTIRTWLDQLASSTPAPGGGAASALNAAVGAALVEMVCNLTIGKRVPGAGKSTTAQFLARQLRMRSIVRD